MFQIVEVSADYEVLVTPAKPIKSNGVILTEFNPGWHPKSVYLGLAPIYLLLFQHENGNWAFWFLDEEMNHVPGEVIEELPQSTGNRLLAGLCNLFDGIWDNLVCNTIPEPLTEKQEVFFTLPLSIRRQLLSLYLNNINLSTRYESLPDTSNSPGICKIINFDRRHVVLDIPLLYGIFSPNLLQMSYDALSESGDLLLPSIISGKPLRSTHTYLLGGNRFAYRVVDAEYGLTMYFVAEEIYFRVACIFIPEAKLCLALDINRAQELMPDLARAFVAHVVEYGQALAAHLKEPAVNVVHAWRGVSAMHLGHVIWNDLSGIEHIVKSFSSQKLPQFFVCDCEFQPEMYGPLDEIFPELQGKIVRSSGSFDSAISTFYRSQSLLIKATGTRVTRALADRILKSIRAKQDNLAVEIECLNAVIDGGPIILLGLRTENRTLTDLSGFCVRLIEFLAREVGKATVVIDGHNARSRTPNEFIWSHGEGEATRSPITVEREIVAAIQRHAESSEIRIVNLIGAPLASSLIWCSHCNFFVTFWGAGLAKYRWVCNKPGLVITSRWNLQNLGELHLYDAPQFMEDPAPIEFINEAAVTDHPDAPLLVGLGGHKISSIMNFQVDEQFAHRSVAKLLACHAARRNAKVI